MSDDAHWWWFLSMVLMIIGAFSIGACVEDEVRTKWFEKHGCKVDVIREASHD